jgi:PAS domain S-box-containing protein
MSAQNFEPKVAMDRDICCINFRGLLAYIRHNYGEEGVGRVLQGLTDDENYLIVDKYNPENVTPLNQMHLTDPAYWVSNEFSLKLLENVRGVVREKDPLFCAGEETIVKHLSWSNLFITRLLSPKFLARQSSRLNAKFNNTKVVRLMDFAPRSASFELKYRPGFRVTKDVCDWNRGIYSGIAKAAGATNVVCEETECVVEGSKACIFRLEWTQASLLKGLVRIFLKPFVQDLWEDYEVIISDRDKLIHHLKESEERYRTLAQNSLTGVYICKEGVFAYVNNRLADILNYPMEEMVGAPIGQFMLAKGETDVERVMFLDALQGSGPISSEVQLCDRHGKNLWLQVMSTRLEHKGQQAILGNVVDITERKWAEEAVVRAKKEWEQTFDVVPDLIAILDRDYRIVRVNRAMAAKLGMTPKECIGLKCYELVHGTANPPPYCPHRQLLLDEIEHTTEVCGGRLRGDFIVSVSPLFDPAGKLKGSVHVARDITDRKILESQLVQAQKMEAIGTLAGGIAHDFNNILAAIVGYSEIIKVRFTEPGLQRYLEQILGSCDRAKSLVRQILTFSRVTEKERKPIDMAFHIKEALKLLRATLPTTITFREKIDPGTYTILADPTQIHQVLLNLCTNAAYAMREKGGTLEISLDNLEIAPHLMPSNVDLSPGPYVVFSVSDTGTGIAPEIMHRIFDPFFTTKMTGEGTGLGLSVVYGIVKGCGGTVTVQSGPGVGSVFSVYLPAVTNIPEMKADHVGPIPGGKDRILLVDDEEVLVKMSKEILEALGYQITVTTDSTSALELFRSHPDDFDVVITDMTMPRMTGLDLSKEILNIRPNTPIILCTGFNELVTEEKARALGIQGFAMKPVSLRTIAELIRKALEKKAVT